MESQSSYFRLLASGPASARAVWATDQEWQVNRVDLNMYIIIIRYPVASKYQRDLTYNVIHLKIYKQTLRVLHNSFFSLNAFSTSPTEFYPNMNIFMISEVFY